MMLFGEDWITSTSFTIPMEIVGPLLGKEGRNLDSIRRYTQTKVYVNKDIGSKDEALVQIEGFVSHLQRAEFVIQRVVNLCMSQKDHPEQRSFIPETEILLIILDVCLGL